MKYVFSEVMPLAALLSAAASAQPVEAPAPPPTRPVVLLAPTEQAGAAHSAALAMRSQLVGLGLELQEAPVEVLPQGFEEQVQLVNQIAASANALVVVWCNLELLEQVFIYAVEPGGGRVLHRDLRAEGYDRDARLEALAFIVRTAAAAQLKEPERPPPLAPRASAPRWLRLELGYGLFSYADEQALQHGPRLGLGVVALPWLRAGLAYRVLPAITVETEHLGVVLRQHPVELFAAYPWHYGDLCVETGGAVVVEVLDWRVIPKSDLVATDYPSTRWSASLGPQVALLWRLSEVARLQVRLGADVPINERKLGVLRGERTDIVLRPWPVRPWIEAGLTADFF